MERRHPVEMQWQPGGHRVVRQVQRGGVWGWQLVLVLVVVRRWRRWRRRWRRMVVLLVLCGKVVVVHLLLLLLLREIVQIAYRRPRAGC